MHERVTVAATAATAATAAAATREWGKIGALLNMRVRKEETPEAGRPRVSEKVIVVRWERG